MMTEYAFLVQTLELPEDAVSKSAADQGQMIAEKLAALVEPLQISLESFDHGGWQVLSHDLLQTNGSLIVSFLISRQQRGNS